MTLERTVVGAERQMRGWLLWITVFVGLLLSPGCAHSSVTRFSAQRVEMPAGVRWRNAVAAYTVARRKKIASSSRFFCCVQSVTLRLLSGLSGQKIRLFFTLPILLPAYIRCNNLKIITPASIDSELASFRRR
nr:hypothetical protein [uncultured Dyadobacter sp.]